MSSYSCIVRAYIKYIHATVRYTYLTYLPTYLPTYQPTYSPTLPTYLLTLPTPLTYLNKKKIALHRRDRKTYLIH